MNAVALVQHKISGRDIDFIAAVDGTDKKFFFVKAANLRQGFIGNGAILIDTEFHQFHASAREQIDI